MARIAETLKVDIPCPKCAGETKPSLTRLEDDPKLTGDARGVEFRVKTGRTLNEAVKSLDGVNRALRNFGKRRKEALEQGLDYGDLALAGADQANGEGVAHHATS